MLGFFLKEIFSDEPDLQFSPPFGLMTVTELSTAGFGIETLLVEEDIFVLNTMENIPLTP